MAPMPPATAAAKKTTRRMIGSTPSRRPTPAQTPPRIPSAGFRRSGRVVVAPIAVMFSVAPGEAQRQQRDAGGREDRRRRVSEAQRQSVELVEQQQDAEPADREPGDEGRCVEAVLHPPATVQASLPRR